VPLGEVATAVAMKLLTNAALLVIVMACSGAPSAPSVTSGRTAPGVRITGLEGFAPFLVKGEVVQLKATLTYSHGHGRDCTADATWSRTNPDFRDLVRLSSGVPGQITANGFSGTIVVTAKCEEQLGSLPVRVDAWRLQGLVRESPDNQPAVNAVVENPDDFLSGIGVEPNGMFSMAFSALASRVRISKKGFEPIVAEIAWNRTPVITRTFELKPLQGSKILDAGANLCWSSGDGGISDWADPNRPATAPDPRYCVNGLQTANVYTFTLPRNGRLHVDDFWALDYNDYVAIDLRCNGSLVGSALQQDHWWGRAIDVDGRTDCHYALRFRQKSRYPVLHYDFIVSVD